MPEGNSVLWPGMTIAEIKLVSVAVSEQHAQTTYINILHIFKILQDYDFKITDFKDSSSD